jgi:hypothetical protein
MNLVEFTKNERTGRLASKKVYINPNYVMSVEQFMEYDKKVVTVIVMADDHGYRVEESFFDVIKKLNNV